MSPRSLKLPERIAVTGLGLITPHGADCAESWRALCAGRRGVRRLTLEELWPPGMPRRPVDAAWRDGWGGAPAAPLRGRAVCGEPSIDLTLAAAEEGASQARLTEVEPERRGCVLGTSKGGLATFSRLRTSGQEQDGDRERERFWSLVPPSGAAAAVAERLDCRGPCLAPVATCATGVVAMIRAAALLRSGTCDAVVAGAGDASLHLPALASFRRLGVQADLSEDPGAACRPCDERRRGFAVGEGAGVIVLERWEHAVARGAPLLAEWVDGLERAEPAGLTILPESSASLERLVRDLLARSGLSPRDVQGVSLHATGTRMNDAYESQGLAAALGDGGTALGFGLKGGIGHLLGAAGSVETVAAICALREQRLPPTVNHEQAAGDCPFPLTGARSAPRPLEHLLKVSLGFGGHLAACLLRRAPDAATGGDQPAASDS